jgi:hypothetical protein
MSIIKKFTTENRLVKFLATLDLDYIHLNRYKVILATSHTDVYRIYITEELHDKYEIISNDTGLYTYFNNLIIKASRSRRIKGFLNSI